MIIVPSEICIVAKEKRLIESMSQGLARAGIACEILQSSEANFESDKVKSGDHAFY